jgi:hypothetical protein
LHLIAKAGSGKSVLTKHIFKKLSGDVADVARKETSLLIYHCCDQRTRFDETASSILSSLIHQIIVENPLLFDKVIATSQLMQSYSSLKRGTSWTFDSLWSIFEALVIGSQLQVLYCIIDALDECERESMENLLPKLTELLDRGTSGTTLKLLLTSQKQGHIIDCLEGHVESLYIDSARFHLD